MASTGAVAAASALGLAAGEVADRKKLHKTKFCVIVIINDNNNKAVSDQGGRRAYKKETLFGHGVGEEPIERLAGH